MISNPNDSALEKRVEGLEELLRANPFESASVRNGRLRFIGGLLRVDAGGRVQIVGTLEIDGHTTSTGVFDINGPWNMAGDGTITGDVTIAGNVTATGEWTQIGEWHLNGDGSITGNVDITGILTLLSELRVSSIGKITVGGLVIDPADGGKITFPGGAQLRADVGNGIQMQIGSVKISAQESFIQLTIGTRSIIINSTGISATLPTVSLASAPAGAYVGAIIGNASNQMFRVVA